MFAEGAGIFPESLCFDKGRAGDLRNILLITFIVMVSGVRVAAPEESTSREMGRTENSL